MQLFVLKKDGTECEMKSVKEVGKCSHKKTKLTWLSCNMGEYVLPQELDRNCISPVLQWPVTLIKTIKVKWKEQAEAKRIQTPPVSRWIPQFDVSAFITVSLLEATFTETDMDQELKVVTHIFQKIAHDKEIKTQTKFHENFVKCIDAIDAISAYID